MPNFSFVLLYVENPPASAGFYADLLGQPRHRDLADLCDAAVDGRRHARIVVAQDRRARRHIAGRRRRSRFHGQRCRRGRGDVCRLEAARSDDHPATRSIWISATPSSPSIPTGIGCACLLRRRHDQELGCQERGCKNWIAVASAEHVRIGRSQGFMQVCHGKAAPLRRIQPGDGVVYYSPTSVLSQRGSTAVVYGDRRRPRRQPLSGGAGGDFMSVPPRRRLGARPRKYRSSPCSAGSNSRRRNATGVISCASGCSKFPGTIWRRSRPQWACRRRVNATAPGPQLTMRSRFSQYGLRSSRFRILPAPESGSGVAVMSTLRGHL